MSTTKRHKKRKNKQKGGTWFDDLQAKVNGMLPFVQTKTNLFDNFKTRVEDTTRGIANRTAELTNRLKSTLTSTLTSNPATLGNTGGSTRKHRKHRKK